MLSRKKYAYLAFLLLLLQALIPTWLMPGADGWQLPESGYLSILFFASSLSLGVLPFFLQKKHANDVSSKRSGLSLPFIVSVLLVGSWLLATIISLPENPLDKRTADMLPILDKMSERLLDGTAVYAPMDEVWEGLRPIYLPGFWLPYVPAVLMGIDIRLVNYCWFGGCLLGFLSTLTFTQNAFAQNAKFKGAISPLLQVAFCSLIMIPLSYWWWEYPIFIFHIEELVVIGHYLFLCWALVRRKSWMLGLALSLCLMSRYGFLFWIPIYACYELYRGNYSYVYKTSAWAVVITAAMILVSGAYTQLDFLMGLQKSYFATITDPQNQTTYAHLLYDFLGMAKFFVPANPPLLQKLFIAGMVLAPIVGILWLIKWKEKDPDIAGLLSLQLTLCFFYNFIIGPYIYLFYTLLFCTWALQMYVLFPPIKRG